MLLLPLSCNLKTEWLRDDLSLQFVAATALFRAARLSRPATCAWEVTGTGVRLVTYTPPGWLGSILISCWMAGVLLEEEEEEEEERRSRMVSL